MAGGLATHGATPPAAPDDGGFGLHVCFFSGDAPGRERASGRLPLKAAIGAGWARTNTASRGRAPDYGTTYYAALVTDPEGSRMRPIAAGPRRGDDGARWLLAGGPLCRIGERRAADPGGKMRTTAICWKALQESGPARSLAEKGCRLLRQ